MADIILRENTFEPKLKLFHPNELTCKEKIKLQWLKGSSKKFSFLLKIIKILIFRSKAYQLTKTIKLKLIFHMRKTNKTFHDSCQRKSRNNNNHKNCHFHRQTPLSTDIIDYNEWPSHRTWLYLFVYQAHDIHKRNQYVECSINYTNRICSCDNTKWKSSIIVYTYTAP